MGTTQTWLLHDHRHYEELLLDCKRRLEGEDWLRVREALRDLVALLKGHFLAEEEVLFPAYEGLVDTPACPTQHLREEHNRMRELLRELTKAVEQRDVGCISKAFSDLQHIMEGHHEKEEEIFLPMAGHALLEKREEVMERLKRLDWKGALKNWKL